MAEQALVQKRGRVKGVLTRLRAFADNITENISPEEISVRLNTLEDNWNEFKTIEDNLLLFENQTSDMEEYERKYYDTKVALVRAVNNSVPHVNQEISFAEQFNSTMTQFMTQQQGILQGLTTRNNASDASYAGSVTARLPKLNIPHFSGEYSEWPSFRDLFESSVHNNSSLTGSQKLQYLKGSLAGNAANVIKHLTISDANYTEAWTKTFVNHPTISSPGVKPLRILCDTFDEVLRGLKALGNEAENRDPWLIHLALTKLDNETKELWAEKMTESHFPKFDDFLIFLTKRCDALETCSTLTKRSMPPIKSMIATSATVKRDSIPVTCLRCSKDHPIYQCEIFKAESPEVRKALVISKALCFKCLGSGHSVRSCHSKVHCRLCNGRHHPLLHTPVRSQTAVSHVTQADAATENPSGSQGAPIHACCYSNQSQPSSQPLRHSNISGIRSSSSINTIKSPINTSSINSELQSTPTTLSSLNTCVERKVFSNKFDGQTPQCTIGALLPTAIVNVQNNLGNLVPCRALLDSGSQVSLMSESCVQRLGLKRENARLSVKGVQSSGAGYTRGKLSIDIHSRWSARDRIKTTVFILSKLTSHIPAKTQVIPRKWNVDNLRLADPKFNEPSHIDIILGADHFLQILLAEKLYDDAGEPVAQNTIFGWVFFSTPHVPSPSLVSLSTTIDNVDKTLQLFWNAEEINGLGTASLSAEEQECEKHFLENVTRNEHGRYIVALPFKNHNTPFGESKSNTIKRLYAMERRFSKYPTFKEQYVQFMREYELLKHMEPIPKNEENIDDQSCYYLPHHAVFKTEPVPKIRVVFDGSCKSSFGVSLNDKLMVGPTIQRDLQAILLSFRKSNIAFAADVEKMYRQVLVARADRDYQRIVWRETSSSPIIHYRLNTITYGTASAPFQAIRTLYQIAEDNKEKFPEAASILQSDFYVDDLLSGCDTLPKALLLRTEISNVLESSGFHLTKWKSNSPEFLKDDIKSESCEINRELKIDNNPEVTKILGILWNYKEDVFSFTVSLKNSNVVTKRIILSEASRVFDPLGWLSPTIVVVKMLFQELWLSKKDWDDEVSPKVLHKWECWKSQLPELTRIKIPRQLWSNPSKIQLHGFSDASEAAYGAVVYCRSMNLQGLIEIRLVAAKSKVAPLKQVSLPRLELCAALLLVRLVEKVKESLSLKKIPLYAWTDSTIVLSWLSDVPRRWKTYVANRTAEILTSIPRSHWRHVPSKENPADLTSRGVSPRDLPILQFWWSGPKWLLDDINNWPQATPLSSNSDIKKEERNKNIVSLLQEASGNTLLQTIHRFSSFSKLIRVIAYCLRFASYCKRDKTKGESACLSAQEIHNATLICIKCSQEGSFSKEIKDLNTEQAVSQKSSLKALTPFLDEKGILRVGGRLQRSHASMCAKHPVILHKSCLFTELLVREMHRTHLHPGTSLLIAILRQRYWIICLRDLARRVSRKCISCFRQWTVRSSQLMGNLPESRVTAARPFYRVGIDYAGPLSLCTKTGRGAKPFKGYISLFICLVTKGLHLELVSNLTTEAFIAALRRFTSRRGIPSHIFSDNGTNFVGAKRHLNELHEFVLSNRSNEEICHFLSQSRVEWSFIPPNAPHFGGLWEVNVKAVKWHLRRVVGESILIFEEMTTLLHQIEAILNSRPYCQLTPDPDDLDALTPSHFLIGEPLTVLPEPDLTEISTSRLGRWQHLQAMVQGFWKRWHLEYLSSLQERPKWRKEVDSLKKDELVLIGDNNLPPSKWLLGRIESTHPGEDGLVRVVMIRTKRGILKRAINKVFKLPSC